MVWNGILMCGSALGTYFGIRYKLYRKKVKSVAEGGVQVAGLVAAVGEHLGHQGLVSNANAASGFAQALASAMVDSPTSSAGDRAELRDEVPSSRHRDIVLQMSPM